MTLKMAETKYLIIPIVEPDTLAYYELPLELENKSQSGRFFNKLTNELMSGLFRFSLSSCRYLFELILKQVIFLIFHFNFFFHSR